MQRSPDVKDETNINESSDINQSQTSTKQDEKKTSTRKFHNGWTRQLENLVAEWADKASCYQWMHQKTENKYQRLNMYYTIPVIILSTLTGTANFATDAVVTTVDMKKFVTFGIGAISIITGIISTVANFLRYAQGSEAHRVAGISWGKFQRFISIELSLHPNERMDAMSFLKMGRIELDRLIEQSPPIPTQTVEQFIAAFRDKPDIKRPEIAGGIEHTRIFEDRDSRLTKIIAEAAYTIQQKKGLMRQLVLEDIDKQIIHRTKEERNDMEEKLRQEILDISRDAAITALKSVAISQINKTALQQLNSKSAREEVIKVVPTGIVERTKERITRGKITHEDSSEIPYESITQTRAPTPERQSINPRDIAAEAAKVALERQKHTESSLQEDGPSSIRLEIYEDDGFKQ